MFKQDFVELNAAIWKLYRANRKKLSKETRLMSTSQAETHLSGD